jgi:lantibiotic modifying enzyme
MSNVEILKACDNYFNQTKYKDNVKDFLDKMTTQIIDGKNLNVSETGNVNLTGMFIGKAGIGYQLLRFFDWENIPSTLCLETPLFYYKTLH